MTLVLELTPEITRALENEANRLGIATEKLAVDMLAKGSTAFEKENILDMAEELFNERASAYEALAEGAK